MGNPARWSGAISFDDCIKQLEDVKKEKERPVTIKAPAGISSRENFFSRIDEAIEFVKESDPVRQKQRLEKERRDAEAAAAAAKSEAEKEELRRKQAEEEEAFRQARIATAQKEVDDNVEKIKEFAKLAEQLEQQKAKGDAAVAAATAPDCEWMFGDVVNAWAARFNPMRWSGSLSFEAAVKQLEDEKAKEAADRVIVVKLPSGVLSSERKFQSIQEAIDFISSQDPKQLKLQADEVDVALQNAVKCMEDAQNKLQSWTNELEEAKEPLSGGTGGYS